MLLFYPTIKFGNIPEKPSHGMSSIYMIRFYFHTPFRGIYQAQCYERDKIELSSRENTICN